VISRPAIAAGIFIASCVLQGQALAEPEQNAIATRARLVSQTTPTYPAEKAGEGWVVVEFDVNEDGLVENTRVTDSLGNIAFEIAAMNSVTQRKFEPARQDGKPVRQYRNQALVSFSLDSNRPTSRLVEEQIEMIRRLTMTIYRDEAKSRIERILRRRDLDLPDLSRLWVLMSMYELEEQNWVWLDAAIDRATMNHGKWIEASTHESLLILGVHAKLQLGLHAAAIRQFETLSKTKGGRQSERAELAGAIENLKVIIAGDDVIRVDAEIQPNVACSDCDSSWQFTPVRRRFSLGNATGRLNRVNIKCDHHQSTSKVSYDIEWAIPASWGECDVEIVGDAGVAFSIFQLPEGES
jgi:TonB family protein